MNRKRRERRTPKSPQNVWFGEQTTNEMCFVFLGATSDAPGRIRAHRIDGLPEKK